MRIEFVSTIAMIAPDQALSRRLYVEGLGLPLDGEQVGGYIHSAEVEGTKHFAVWPLSQAAEACFGEPSWPDHLPVPQVSIEFDVADAAAVLDAAEELEDSGWELLHHPRLEPWGQTVARLLSPEGAIVGISHIPSMHA